MPRKPRVNAPGLVHHVTIRANDGAALLVDDEDRWRHLGLLSDVVRETSIRCLAFCQMTTHVHLLIQERDVPLVRAMHLLNSRFSRHVNARHDRVGHVQGGRYGDSVVETEGHLVNAFVYLWRNPCEAGMCARPQDWPWSSYAALVGEARPWSFVDATWFLSQLAPRREDALRIVRERVEQVPGPGTCPGARHQDQTGCEASLNSRNSPVTR